MSYSIQSMYNWYRNTLRNPKYRWWIILGTIAYLFMPFDIAPDFLPIIGQVDDVALVTLLVAELSQMMVGYFKTRQGETVEEAASPVTEGSSEKNATVDVQATSVNQS
ncbi:YkvA family protein [Phormidium sp. CCY1219]|jgi:uncharacterized membrane protein YkvA (DUF1232 family)|uniref:YkvA family protein n=1 Tax=Phormidium sp. CCY1219 TaxID=2886104 RepID=UPI002D1EA325|nr:YkvA family protein [Phormidium sp. CCY1219]MEB3829417.1 DUF1232 domain-containing protein [Phormidium sp. CCY1219]